MTRMVSKIAMVVKVYVGIDYRTCLISLNSSSAYCQQLEEMVAEKIEVFSAIRDRARNFRKCLADEESKSRLLMHKN